MHALTQLWLVAILIVALVAVPDMAGAYRLVWDAPTTGGSVEGYLVEVSTDEGLTWAFNYTVPGDKTELPLDDKCQFNTAYGFRVSAFNAAGIGKPCAPIHWTRPPYKPPPDKPLPAVNGGRQPQNVSGAKVE